MFWVELPLEEGRGLAERNGDVKWPPADIPERSDLARLERLTNPLALAVCFGSGGSRLSLVSLL